MWFTRVYLKTGNMTSSKGFSPDEAFFAEILCVLQEKRSTAGGKCLLFGHADGFQADPSSRASLQSLIPLFTHLLRQPTSGNCVGRASLRYAVSLQAACNARTHAEPSFLNTTSTVFSRILMSIPIFQFSIYSLSSLTTSSKSVILLRPLTCHIPVIPGLIASLAWW